ncbi:hypothetical protein SDC9_192386 [bioreactor metagenome]|uniref:Uncharacterized protein n=1 Tax=bioreactor metagenome TaxID=1076179 RepID=A0A645I306_9ZZZZ
MNFGIGLRRFFTRQPAQRTAERNGVVAIVSAVGFVNKLRTAQQADNPSTAVDWSLRLVGRVPVSIPVAGGLLGHVVFIKPCHPVRNVDHSVC